MGCEGRGRLRLTDHRLRVAAVGVSPPNYKASGGISAGLQLMRRVADSCDTAMYVMADRDEDIVDGQLKVALRRPFNPLSALGFMLPRQATTMAWRPRIERWLEDFAPDIVHIHNPHPAGALAKVAGACLRLDVPYVISTHGFVEFDDFSKGFGSPAWQKPLLERFVRRPLVEVARNAARILMLSPYEEPILRGWESRQTDWAWCRMGLTGISSTNRAMPSGAGSSRASICRRIARGCCSSVTIR